MADFKDVVCLQITSDCLHNREGLDFELSPDISGCVEWLFEGFGIDHS